MQKPGQQSGAQVRLRVARVLAEQYLSSIGVTLSHTVSRRSHAGTIATSSDSFGAPLAQGHAPNRPLPVGIGHGAIAAMIERSGSKKGRPATASARSMAQRKAFNALKRKLPD